MMRGWRKRWHKFLPCNGTSSYSPRRRAHMTLLNPMIAFNPMYALINWYWEGNTCSRCGYFDACSTQEIGKAKGCFVWKGTVPRCSIWQGRSRIIAAICHTFHMQVIQSRILPIFSNTYIVHYTMRTWMVIA